MSQGSYTYDMIKDGRIVVPLVPELFESNGLVPLRFVDSRIVDLDRCATDIIGCLMVDKVGLPQVTRKVISTDMHSISETIGLSEGYCWGLYGGWISLPFERLNSIRYISKVCEANRAECKAGYEDGIAAAAHFNLDTEKEPEKPEAITQAGQIDGVIENGRVVIARLHGLFTSNNLKPTQLPFACFEDDGQRFASIVGALLANKLGFDQSVKICMPKATFPNIDRISALLRVSSYYCCGFENSWINMPEEVTSVLTDSLSGTAQIEFISGTKGGRVALSQFQFDKHTFRSVLDVLTSGQ